MVDWTTFAASMNTSRYFACKFEARKPNEIVFQLKTTPVQDLITLQNINDAHADVCVHLLLTTAYTSLAAAHEKPADVTRIWDTFARRMKGVLKALGYTLG